MANRIDACSDVRVAVPVPVTDSSSRRRLRLLVLAHTNRSAGARSVAVNLLRVLATEFEDIELIAVVPVGCDYEQIGGLLSTRAIWFDQRGSFTRRLVFDRFVLPTHVRSIKPDAILSLGSIGMRNPGAPQAILVQDPHFVYPASHYGRMTVLQHLRYFVQRRQVRHCLGRVGIVCGQTRTMLKRIQDTFQTSAPGKLLPKAISFNVSRNLNDTSQPPEFAPYGECFRMICLTRYYPHKNLEGIVEAFQRFRKELRDAVVFITITPNQHPGARRLLRRIERGCLSEQIVNIGPVEQRRIPSLFGHCHALLLPTFMESFSATYLEAMALDLPVLTSDLDFAHEICGPAALYFDPWSSESIVEVILRTKDDVRLREQLVETGRLRLADVHNRSWEEIATDAVSSLRALAESRISSHARRDELC